MPDADRVNLFNHLLSQDNRMLVVIDLDVTDNEASDLRYDQQRRNPADGADIIKNALYQRAIELMGKPTR